METVDEIELLKIVEVLKHVHSRVSMYIGRKDDVNAVVCFLQGFFTACDTLGFRYGSETRHQVFSENGWEHRADGGWLQMREKGMSEEAIVQELMRLEVEKWKKLVTVSPSD